MSPMINDDELIILFKLSSAKEPVPPTDIHKPEFVETLIAKGYAKAQVIHGEHSGLVITNDGRWKYTSMVGIAPPVPRKIAQLMKQKGLQ